MSNVAKLKKRALEYEQKKQFDKALDAYLQVLGALGDHVEEADVALFNRVGDLLVRQGNVSSAVDHYERAVDLYTEGGFHNNAIALCNKILRNAPGRNSIYYKLGRISAKKGFSSDAKSNFLEYADRMQRIGHVDEAFRALKEFADLCPDQDDIRLMLAEQLVRGERKAEAIEQLQLLFEKFESEGRMQEAKATMERMVAIDPSHQPRPGVMRPTPKVNDLIFLDVNYDGPARQVQTSTGGVRLVASAEAAAPLDPVELEPPQIATEQDIPMLEIDQVDVLEIMPVDGLSAGASFDSADDGATISTNGSISQFDPELIVGFEETSLGGIDRESSAIAPVGDIQRSASLDVDAGELSELSAETDPSPATAGATGATGAAGAAGAIGAASGRVGDGNDAEALPLLDISLELIDEDESSGGELAFVFPPDDATADVDSADAAPWTGDSEDELRLETLLQLPELESGAEAMKQLGQEPELPRIAHGENGSRSGMDGGEAEVELSPSSGVELHFLDVGNDAGETVHSGSREISGFEFLDIGVPASEPSDEEPSIPEAPEAPEAPLTPDALRTRIELDPSDWELRRQLAEALLETGDREGGLAELETAMLGFERAGDGRSAKAIVDEMIRVEPGDVRHHQKRVEYAVLANDRSLLAEAYYSLAESLFQMGELPKSRAVYARVLELTPGDPGVRAAIEAIDATCVADVTEEPAAELEAVETPDAGTAATAAPTDAPTARMRVQPWASSAADAAADQPAAALPIKPDLPPAPAAAGFVNLADWLSEDAPARNTRMTAEVKELQIQEQVDFREMLAMFKQGVAANVDEADHEAHYDLGVAYKEMGLLDDAISEFQKALRGTERRGRTYEALGQCFVEKGQHQIAVTILSRALGDKSITDDMLVGVLYLLGFASETLGRWADAQRFYERVFAVDIEFRDIAKRLAGAERGGK